MTAITNHDKGCVITDKKFSELEKLGITVYFLPEKGVHMILAEDGIKALADARKEERQKALDAVEKIIGNWLEKMFTEKSEIAAKKELRQEIQSLRGDKT